MRVRLAVVQRCLDCHGIRAEHFSAPDTSCATCHVPLPQATRLVREDVGRFPVPQSHREPGFASSLHGKLARGSGSEVSASCATCHAREFCIQCHVNAPEVPQIQAFAPDPRSTAIRSRAQGTTGSSESGFCLSAWRSSPEVISHLRDLPHPGELSHLSPRQARGGPGPAGRWAGTRQGRQHSAPSDRPHMDRTSRRFMERWRTPDLKPVRVVMCGRSVSTAIGPIRPTPLPGTIQPDFSPGIRQRPTLEKRIAATAITPVSSAPIAT